MSVAPKVCSGCGSYWDDARLAHEKSLNPRILSCCPERKMVDGVWCEQSAEVCTAPECWEACAVVERDLTKMEAGK